MKEIKFRGWFKLWKKMFRVRWLHFDTNGEVYGLLASEDTYTELGNFLAGVDFELMQYTGLKDKRGREIYEGDIVRYGFFALNDNNKFGEEPWNHLPEGVQEGDITTEQLRFAVVWDFRTLYALEQHIHNNPDVLGVEVIGNIYDNPELLSAEVK